MLEAMEFDSRLAPAVIRESGVLKGFMQSSQVLQIQILSNCEK